MCACPVSLTSLAVNLPPLISNKQIKSHFENREASDAFLLMHFFLISFKEEKYFSFWLSDVY